MLTPELLQMAQTLDLQVSEAAQLNTDTLIETRLQHAAALATDLVRKLHEAYEAQPAPAAPPATSSPELDRFMAAHLELQERGVRAFERSHEAMRRLEERTTPAFPTVDLLLLAQCLVQRLQSCQEAVSSLEGGKGLVDAFLMLLAHAQELHDRLKRDALEVGRFPANDLFRALVELGARQREALLRFEGISAHLQDRLREFWLPFPPGAPLNEETVRKSWKRAVQADDNQARERAEALLNALEDLDMDDQNRLLDLVPEELRDALSGFFEIL